MLGRALNSDNDIFIVNGSFATVSGSAKAIQQVRSRLLFYRGEWFLDTLAGVPYYQQIFVKPVNLKNAESILKQIILETEGISSLVEFSLDFDNITRQLSVSFSAKTDDDITTDEVTINA